MRASELMTHPAITCPLGSPLSAAARLMWENDCGVIPVIDDGGRLVGMVTDRDICMAAYTQGAPLDAIETRTAMAPSVLACRADDSVESVERLMKEGQVRRIPIIDDDRRPVGIVSMSDLARHAADERRSQVNREVVSTLATISEPRQFRGQANGRSGGRDAAMPPATESPEQRSTAH
jgi:CBS domain-containing protein